MHLQRAFFRALRSERRFVNTSTNHSSISASSHFFTLTIYSSALPLVFPQPLPNTPNLLAHSFPFFPLPAFPMYSTALPTYISPFSAAPAMLNPCRSRLPPAVNRPQSSVPANPCSLCHWSALRMTFTRKPTFPMQGNVGPQRGDHLTRFVQVHLEVPSTGSTRCLLILPVMHSSHYLRT